MEKYQSKALVLVVGVPASGKSHFAAELNTYFGKAQIPSKIFATDNLQAVFNTQPNFSIQQLNILFRNQDFQAFLSKFSLNKNVFNELNWKKSRQLIRNFSSLDALLSNCQVLIIEDELPLKSQRKPFRKYCAERGIGYLQIQIEVSCQQAIQNNAKRGQFCSYKMVPNQVIQKSFSKFQHNNYAVVLSKQKQKKFLEEEVIKHFQKVVIVDNYTEYLQKKNCVSDHLLNEKQLDQKELRKLVTKIITDEETSSQYFEDFQPIIPKQKSRILCECKKIYINRKRKQDFKAVIRQYMQSYKCETQSNNLN